MHVLVLGGTVFLGRHVVDAALARGDRVTIFNRGRSHPDLFPEVERLRGDRDGGLAPLEGRSFDVVIDTCGYVPRIVSQSARLLADACERYVFVSSLSVYASMAQGPDEAAPVGTLDDESVETVDGATYGPLKALCEQAVEAAVPGRAIHARAGLIVGPHDVSDRFTYWPSRIAEGGEVLAPPDPQQTVQLVDVRDLAYWLLKAAEDGVSGAFNAVGPATPTSFEDMLEACRTATGSTATLRWTDRETLEAHDVSEWMGLPLWLNDEHDAKVQRAMDAGLTFRSLEETAADTWAWACTRPPTHVWRAGITREKEQQVLRAARSLR